MLTAEMILKQDRLKVKQRVYFIYNFNKSVVYTVSHLKLRSRINSV